uniref:Uncharacterized protein n=1 Tax=Setaria viridis TaxID=4556 RepID=A0A4V6D7T8_SETVI|nr:hypothetical protein SEVIR_4G026100v2 [Setaria viridis]TKW19535.1 hypothetical protein SEVIR_4G026100v2 [Setaria viridis]TKW19536.1 hypothetical protein SEVIR_4G026100v2 [Setaria viridis]
MFRPPTWRPPRSRCRRRPLLSPPPSIPHSTSVKSTRRTPPPSRTDPPEMRPRSGRRRRRSAPRRRFMSDSADCWQEPCGPGSAGGAGWLASASR